MISTDALLVILRIGSALLLVGFVAAAFYFMWRDFQTINREVETRTRALGKLVVLHCADEQLAVGSLAPGLSFPLLPVTSLGRAPTNTVVIDDAFTSTEHAVISLRAGTWWLEDRRSSNGTLLNGYRIEEAVVVSTGDVIAVGQVEFRLELEAA